MTILWRADKGRRWGVRVDTFVGPWVSLGVHLDFGAPLIDLHLLWWEISMGRIYRGGRWELTT